MSIHREGRTLLFWLLLILVAVNFGLNRWIPEQETVLNIVLLVSIVLYLLILQFFRNPFIQLPNEEKLVFAPADGKVVVIEETTESEYLKDRRKQVSIFMSPINVHINRSPIAGVVEFFKYHPGKYLVAWHPKASTENERTTVVIENRIFGEILYRQIAGALARRIVNYAQEGMQVVQGTDAGFIKFGSRVDLFLPLDTKIKVTLNQTVKGGETVVAEN